MGDDLPSATGRELQPSLSVREIGLRLSFKNEYHLKEFSFKILTKTHDHLFQITHDKQIVEKFTFFR